MRIAYSYLRFSTPEQIDGDSIRRQRLSAAQWCKERGVHLDETLSFRDLGKSAFSGAHFNEGALGTFFAFVAEGIIKQGSYLVIESLDRFSRENPMIAAGRLFELVKAGITVVTTDDRSEYSLETLSGHDIAPMIMLVVKMSQAHNESLRKQALIAPAWKNKKELARSEKKILTSRCPEWLRVEDGKFVPIVERVTIVKRIFQDAINGCGRREIVRRLNADGVRPFRASSDKPSPGWQTSSVAKILQSPTVLGEYQPHKGTHRLKNRLPDGEPIVDYYPSIIDVETYWRAQNATAQRRQSVSGRKGSKGAHILQGIARCGSCSGPMHILNKGKPPKGGIYLACSSNTRLSGCKNDKRLRVDQLEKDLLAALLFVDASSLSSLEEEAPKISREIDALKARLDEAKARRARLSAVFAKTDDEEIEKHLIQASTDVKVYTGELKELEQALASRQADPGAVARLATANELSLQLEESDASKRRELRIKLSSLIRGLVERVNCKQIGPVMIFKPDLRERRMSGIAPFAIRMEGGVVSVLLERSPDAEALEEFFVGLGGADGMGEVPV